MSVKHYIKLKKYKIYCYVYLKVGKGKNEMRIIVEGIESISTCKI